MRRQLTVRRRPRSVVPESRLASFALVVVVHVLACADASPREAVDAGDDVTDAASDAGPDVSEGVACVLLESSFEPCGGNLVGTWEIERYCPLAESWDPLDGTCPDLVAEGEGEALGRLLVFDNDSYLLEYDERRLTLRFGFPLACYGGASVPCNGQYYNGSCELATETDCACEVDIDYAGETEVGTVETFGSTVVFDIDGTRLSGAYCVDGDTLTLMRFSFGETLGYRMRLRRQL